MSTYLLLQKIVVIELKGIHIYHLHINELHCRSRTFTSTSKTQQKFSVISDLKKLRRQTLPNTMETAIIISSDARNEYLDLVKTQISDEMLDIVGFVIPENKVLSDKLNIIIAQNKGGSDKVDSIIAQNKGLSDKLDIIIAQNKESSQQLQIQDNKLDALLQILCNETKN